MCIRDSTKIDGLVSLLAACELGKLKQLVLFSSAAGFYGNPGQSDYSIANDILNKTAYRFKAQYPNAQVLSFNWGPWDGGMVTPQLKRMFNDRGVYIIPLDAGSKLLVSELSADTNRCAQILVGNDLSKSAQENSGAAVKKLPVSRLSARVIKTLQTANNEFLTDHVIGTDAVLPTVCAIAWMSDAAQSVYPDYVYQGITDYSLFKGVTFTQEALEQNVEIDFTIEMKTQVLDNGHGLLVDCKISSINGAGKTVFHYGGQVHLVTAKPSLMKVGDDVVQKLIRQQSIIDNEHEHELYQNGCLFHGESLQGINRVISCDEQGLLLGCKVADSASFKQGQFMLPELESTTATAQAQNIFANDIVYQAMLVWVKEQLGLGSLPSSTQEWTVYQQVVANQAFYLELKVVNSQGKGSERGQLIADINIISEDHYLLAQVKSAKVTASASLNDLFLTNKAQLTSMES